jgi:hypothetical protein
MLEPDEHYASSAVRTVLLYLRLRLKARWMYCNSQHSRSRRTWDPLPGVPRCSQRPQCPRGCSRRGPAQERRLGNYPFLTPCVEIKKANLYGGSTGAIRGRFSNVAAVNVTRSRNGLRGDRVRAMVSRTTCLRSRLLASVVLGYNSVYPCTREQSRIGSICPESLSRALRCEHPILTISLCFKPTRRDTRRRSAQPHPSPQPLHGSSKRAVDELPTIKCVMARVSQCVPHAPKKDPYPWLASDSGFLSRSSYQLVPYRPGIFSNRGGEITPGLSPTRKLSRNGPEGDLWPGCPGLFGTAVFVGKFPSSG